MNPVLRDPALRTLLRLKLRGAARKQWRRLKTPKGLALTLVGGLLFALWFGAIALQWFFGERIPVPLEDLRPAIRLGGAAVVALAISGALNHRGLYLPREEIERLFSAPVTRANLIRYRLLASLGRAVFGGVVLGLVTMRHMPRPLFGFVGVFVALQTLPLVGQIAAILAGSLEKNVVRRFRHLRTVLLVVVSLLAAGVFYFAAAGEEGARDMARVLGIDALGSGTPQAFADFVAHPVVAALTLPFEPWSRLIAAEGAGEFGLWLALNLGIWVLLFELAARLPLDFRELSLETSASVAERIRRVRRAGGGAAAGRVSRRTLGMRIPWLFGRGPVGAIAWRKSGAILRKARGTVLVSVLIVGFVTFVSAAFVDGEEGEIVGPLLVAGLGMVYLTAGLRFDFRDELDRMESLKAWPLRPWQVFAAMLLPEVLLVSALLVGAVVLRMAMADSLNPVALGVAGGLPFLVFAWVALDNAIFLFLPVRFVPGQEGALQNMGRGIILVFLRMVSLALVVSVSVGGALALGLGLLRLEVDRMWAMTGAYCVGWGVLFLWDLVLVWIGGAMFRRFDVAADRG